jgi:Uma2 family endonuclease
MATGTLVSVEEYLNTSYHPDCDYIDGRIVERNVGERDHSELQAELIIYLSALRSKLGLHIFPEQRVQISPTRYRVPDICVVVGPRPSTQILQEPPFLCIEILSKDDRVGDMQEKIDDYLGFGVPYVWVINPKNRKAHEHTASSIREVKDGNLSTQNPDITVSLAEIYRSLE